MEGGGQAQDLVQHLRHNLKTQCLVIFKGLYVGKYGAIFLWIADLGTSQRRLGKRGNRKGEQWERARKWKEQKNTEVEYTKVKRLKSKYWRFSGGGIIIFGGGIQLRFFFLGCK
jgi:hypothetical protein